MKSLDKSVFIVLGIWFVFLFVLNLLTPTQGDELGDPKLFLPMQSYGGEVVFGGIESAYGAFMNWNPRLGNLLLAAYMSGLSEMPPYFDFLNACVGTGFIFLIFFLIYGRIPRDFHDSVILIVIVFFCLLYAPFGDNFLYTGSSLNYLWGYSLIGIALIPYRLILEKIMPHLTLGKATHTNMSALQLDSTTTSFSIRNLFYNLGFFILAFLAGMCSEVGGIIVLLTLIAFGFYIRFIKKITLPSWYYIGMFGILLGWLVLYFAPGSANVGNEYLREIATYKCVLQKCHAWWNLYYHRTFSYHCHCRKD